VITVVEKGQGSNSAIVPTQLHGIGLFHAAPDSTVTTEHSFRGIVGSVAVGGSVSPFNSCSKLRCLMYGILVQVNEINTAVFGWSIP
jgi:hypothetical protein